MSRFYLSNEAKLDLDTIRTYLQDIPREPAQRIAEQIQKTLHSIGSEPFRGVGQSELSRLLGQEVRSRLTAPYRIYYVVGPTAPEIFAILHGSRDGRTILADRVQ